MSGHTPGPWAVIPGLNGAPHQVVAFNANVAITRWGSFSRPASDEAKANARLIAAAPDLLEALTRLKREAELDGLASRAGWDCWIDQANRALAKATGAAALALALFAAPADAGENGYFGLAEGSVIGTPCLTHDPDGSCAIPLGGWEIVIVNGDECVQRIGSRTCRGALSPRVIPVDPETPVIPTDPLPEMPTAIPLPAGVWMLLAALGGLGWIGRKRG